VKKGWASARLEELFEVKYVPVYGSNGVVGRHDEALTSGPTILIGRKGSAGEVHVSMEPCWPIDTTYYVDELPAKFPIRYWALYLKSLGLLKQDKSSAIPSLRREDLYSNIVPVPPLAEQDRIVSKLDELLGRVTACQERLEKVPAILKRFRQSVLAAACSGRLTEDWRREKSLNEDGLPKDWRWVSVEELVPKGGIFDGPFGSNLKSSDYTERGVRVIRLENIGHLEFLGDKETFVSVEKYKTLTRHEVGQGDVVFASFIDGEVRTCVLPKLSVKAIAKADCFCLRPLEDKVNRSFLTFQLVCRESLNTLVGSIHGATRPRINTTQLKQLKVRICSRAEQDEIVRRVEALFKRAEQLEAHLVSAKGSVDQLTQSILAKAFRGELVPQDPLAEPAGALLARIKSKCESGQSKARRRAAAV
jgi:type I restriction enzyme, S subunit